MHWRSHGGRDRIKVVHFPYYNSAKLLGMAKTHPVAFIASDLISYMQIKTLLQKKCTVTKNSEVLSFCFDTKIIIKRTMWGLRAYLKIMLSCLALGSGCDSS